MISWKKVKGFEELYLVGPEGSVYSVKSKRLLSPCLDTKGYPQVTLCDSTFEKKMRVHRIVAEAFLPNPKNKPQVNHRDGDKTNNYLYNLEWCTNLENIRHAYKNGLMNQCKGIDVYCAKLNEDDVLFIRTFRQLYSFSELASLFGINKSTVRSAFNGKTWRHI